MIRNDDERKKNYRQAFQDGSRFQKLYIYLLQFTPFSFYISFFFNGTVRSFLHNFPDYFVYIKILQNKVIELWFIKPRVLIIRISSQERIE